MVKEKLIDTGAIEKEFSDIIINKLTEYQFWQWVRGWKDPLSLVEQAENWDIDTKIAEIKKLRKVIR